MNALSTLVADSWMGRWKNRSRRGEGPNCLAISAAALLPPNSDCWLINLDAVLWRRVPGSLRWLSVRAFSSRSILPVES